MTTLQCNEMVSDGRFSMHQCTRDAIPTSNYCQQHHDKYHPPEFTAVDTPYRPEIRERVTVSATLTWRAGEGPTIKLKYASKPLAVTKVRITVNSDNDNSSLDVSGVNLKKDGTPSQVTRDSRYITLQDLPETARKIVQDEITHLLSLLPGGGAR